MTVWDGNYGDCNGDGEINSNDIYLLRKYLIDFNLETNESSVELSKEADSNADGVIDLLDLTAIRKYLANYDYDTNTPGFTLGKAQ